MRQDPREIEFYWRYELPHAMRKIAKLREKGHKATAIWIDESIVTLSFKLVRVWRFKRERIRLKYKFARSQKTVLLTGVDLDGNTHVDFADKANSITFMRLLSWVIRQYKDYRLVYVFLDNARYHSFLGRLPLNMKLIWLPRYAPECNFDEQFHRLLKRELGLHIFTNIKDVKAVLGKYDGLVRPSLVGKARKILKGYEKRFSKGHQ